MTTTDCLIAFGPFLALLSVMLVWFSVSHFFDVREENHNG
jgi:hypothetical protein